MTGMRRAALRVARDVVVAMASIAAAAFVLDGVLRIRNPTTVALALLLVVLVSATVSRLIVAIVTSVAAVLVLNYFFLPPVGTFIIADTQHWVALLAFVLTAAVGSQLSSAAQRRAREAIESRREIGRLFHLSRDILQTSASEDAMREVARAVARNFDLQSVAICLPNAAGWDIHEGGIHTLQLSAGDLDRGTDAVTLVPLRLGSRPLGFLATERGALGATSLDALGGVVAIAIERAAFLAERKNTEALRHRAELASALLASLSHDLRTPLTAVQVAVANLQDPDLTSDERQEQAAVAVQELDRLNRAFREILEMARIDAAGITPDRQWVTPADIVDAALAHCSAILANRRIDVAVPADLAVQVDPRLTSSALAHLIENAAMYSPAHERIEITGLVDAEGLRLVVRDHGPGLAASEIDRLFDRFYRGAAARQSTSGSGMGLAITRGLLTPEGGRVWADNAPGGGARFSIVVPSATRPVVEVEA